MLWLVVPFKSPLHNTKSVIKHSGQDCSKTIIMIALIVHLAGLTGHHCNSCVEPCVL